MNITPDQADQWRHGTTDGPWEPHPDYPTMLVNLDQKMAVAAIPGNPDDCTPEDEANLALIAAAPDLAQTIAGMTEQWKAEYREIWGAWLAVSDWTTEDKARLALTPDQFKDATTRLVRRLVGPVEEAE